MITGCCIRWLPTAHLIVSQNPMNSSFLAAALSPYLSPGAVGAILQTRAGEGSTTATRRLTYYRLRPDSDHEHSETRRELISSAGMDLVLCGQEIMALASGLTFDYAADGADSGDDYIEVNLVGEVLPAGGLLAPFDLVALSTSNGLLLSGGQSASWLTVSPAGLPPDTIGLIGHLTHAYGSSGSGIERSALYTRAHASAPSRMSRLDTSLASTSMTTPLIMETALGGEFDYQITKVYSTDRPVYANLRASYAIVPGRAGGYVPDAWSTSPVSLMSGGNPTDWTTLSIPGAKAGDLAIIQVSVTEQSSNGVFGYGVQLREIRPNDDHQPTEISAGGSQDTALAYSANGVVPLRTNAAGQVQINRVGDDDVSIEAELLQLYRRAA